MAQLVVAVLGPDRPGVIAALTEVLLADAGNLEDASMTILRGQFAMTLVVDVPLTVPEVEASLAPVAARLGLLVSVREAAPPGPVVPDAVPWVVSVHGADRPGLVHRVAALIARHGGNITDLTTRLTDGLYVLLAEVDLPGGPADLATALSALAVELDVEASVRPADPDVL